MVSTRRHDYRGGMKRRLGRIKRRFWEAGQRMGKHLSRINKTVGFTLIELLIVVLIVAILAAIAIPQYFRYLDSAKVTTSISMMSALRKDLMVYNLQHGAYPATINFADFTDQNGASILTALSTETLLPKMRSWDSYVVSGETYTITATSNDTRHTVLTLTPWGITK